MNLSEDYMHLKIVAQNEEPEIKITKTGKSLFILPIGFSTKKTSYPIGEIVSPNARIYSFLPSFIVNWLLAESK